MTQFEFLTVIISIVLAFGISDILSSWGEQIRLRRKIRPYRLHLAWTVLLLVIMIQVWWSLWTLQDRAEWTFPAYLLLIAPYLTVALIAYMLTPALADGEMDIRRYYYENSRWFFLLAAVYLTTWTIFAVTVLDQPLIDVSSMIRFAGLVLMVVLAGWRNEHFHIAAAVLSYLLFMAWVGINTFTL